MTGTKKAQKQAVDSLRLAINGLNGAFESSFPKGKPINPDEKTMRGSGGDIPLQPIASKIYDVMYCFDKCQATLGLPPGEEPRFAKFFREDAAEGSSTESPSS